ncbi:hypothetical protein APICC_07081 [Apis cerana cerana]|uniref:DUF4758 domain-containing protein n=1 Tax=Apis cerana cerana TaxID=94128 RepID=A0A2A3E4E2_APICC|nr:hypothetical protein APICC_07081 [Apis cerana cerana]
MEAVNGQQSMTMILDLGQKSRSPLMTGFNAFKEMTVPCVLKIHALTENEIKLNMMPPRYIIIAISLIYAARITRITRILSLILKILQSVSLLPNGHSFPHLPLTECATQVYKSQSVETAVVVKPAVANDDFITQTVYGFLDFTTTIGNTVMVFSPQSAPSAGEKEKKSTVSIIQTKPSETKEKVAPAIQPSKTYKTNTEEETKKQVKGTKVVVNSVIEQNVINSSEDNGSRSVKDQEPKTQTQAMTKSPVVSSQVQVKSKDEAPVIKNNLAEPEYDFLSKQPTEIVDETYKLINLRPSSKAHGKPRPTGRREKENPTGLVLQSSSRILSGTPPVPEGKIRPSSTQRILKTIGPQQGKLKPQLEPTPTHQQEESSLPLEVLFSAPAGSTVRSTRKNSTPNSSRPKFRNKINDDYENSGEVQKSKLSKNRSSTTSRPSYKNRNPPTTTTEPPITRRRTGFRPNNQPSLPSKQINKTIRKQVDIEEDQRSSIKIQEVGNDDELDPSESEDVASVSVQDQHSEQQILPIETINVEISTAADMNNVYFEIATIKSPYTFQVGTLRNTRYVTVTSTMKKSFSTIDPSTTISPTEPLTENLLANTGAAYETTLPLDSAVATLPAISLETGQATPPLETLTETFSTTQTLLKTHLLPVVSGNNTTKITLVQTYNIARVVTATKTLPPMDIYQFIPSKALNEFNSKLDEAGSELHLELDVGDEERDDDDIPKRVVAPSNEMDADLEPFKSISSSKVKPMETQSASIESQLTPDQLALLKYFGQQQPQVITTSRPIVVLETLYESHVIPVVNNGNTIYSTLSRPVGTVPRTSYEYGTSTIAPVLTPQLPPQLPHQLPLFPQQPQFTVTSAPLVTQTLATLSDSKVLKLTFGAKTAYTTLFSSRVVPTEITTYVTTTVPVQPTVAPFPGYYPPPVGYPPFPFVG